MLQPKSYSYVLDYEGTPSLALGFAIPPDGTYLSQESPDLVNWTTIQETTAHGPKVGSFTLYISLEDKMAWRIIKKA